MNKRAEHKILSLLLSVALVMGAAAPIGGTTVYAAAADVDNESDFVAALDDNSVGLINVSGNFVLTANIEMTDREVVLTSDNGSIINTSVFTIIIGDGGDLTIGGDLTLEGFGPDLTPQDMDPQNPNPKGLIKVNNGGNAGISIGQGDKSNLPDEVKEALGDRPLIQLTLAVDGRQTDWNNPDAPVTVSIPYSPTAEELANPESIVIWYIDGRGNAVSVPSGRYDPVTGAVTFNCTHFSDFAVVFNPASFSDVPAGAWYSKAVGFIAARDITAGTGGGNFSPGAKLTRGQFIVMLMKAYEITPDVKSSGAAAADNFSDAGNTYYTGYLAAAKRLGISGGVGENRFAPGREITRQEMFTLLYNALKEIGRLPEVNSGKSGTNNTGKPLSSFSDSDGIASWAKEALTLLTETGTVAGSKGKLSPAGTTTRAEMAQVLYNLLSE